MEDERDVDANLICYPPGDSDPDELEGPDEDFFDPCGGDAAEAALVRAGFRVVDLEKETS